MPRVLTLLAAGFEEIEAITVIDLLRRADINTTMVSLEKKLEVSGAHGITVRGDLMTSDVDISGYECLFLPGGQPGTNNLKKNKQVLNWVREFDRTNRLIAAICAAPTVLNAAGILSGRRLTSYPAEKNNFTESIYLEQVTVRDKNLLTSRGVGTAIEFSLLLVEVLRDKQKREQLAKRILWSA